MSCVLAADVGGTKTLVALAEARGTGLAIGAERRYESGAFGSFEALLDDFLALPEVAARASSIGAVCFSVAGPVAGGVTTLTNLRWRMEAGALAARLGGIPVVLINDFAAAGLGIAGLPPGNLVTLQEGVALEHGVRLVIGAGTGLGVGWLTWEGDRYVAHPSEAGHADFAPLDSLQDGLLAYLRRTFGRVSAERVVSGPGLARIYAFLQEAGAGAPAREFLEASARGEDAARIIGELAVAGRDPLAVRALEIFIQAYGAFAGDMALVTLPCGGVYIAGGIAPKIVTRLQDGAFVRAFRNKGRYRELLETIPVRIVLEPRVGLLGALAEAARLAEATRG